jgi:hypothetical protein
VRSAGSTEACACGVVEQRAGELSARISGPELTQLKEIPLTPNPSRVGERGAKFHWVSGNRTDSSLHSAILDDDAYPQLQARVVRNADAVTWAIGVEEV